MNDAAGQKEIPSVVSELRDGVLLVRLNRPERLNAMSPSMGRLYMQTLLDAGADPVVRAIVVTGAGRGFCAGADTSSLGKLANGAARTERLRPHSFVADLPKPVIAAVNGPCVGLGFVIAMMCDLRIAGRSARMGAAYAGMGLPAESGVAWVLARDLGYARAFDILCSDRLYAGDALAHLGLVSEVVADEELLDKALGRAREMATRCSPRSLAVIKRQLQRAASQSLSEAATEADRVLKTCLEAPDFKEVIRARSAQQIPRFEPLPATDAAWWPED